MTANRTRYASETAPDLQNATVLYGPSFAEQRTEAARGFLVAYLRAVRDYHRAFFAKYQYMEQASCGPSAFTSIQVFGPSPTPNPEYCDAAIPRNRTYTARCSSPAERRGHALGECFCEPPRQLEECCGEPPFHETEKPA